MKKKTMKRVLLAVLSLIMLLCVLTACGSATDENAADSIALPNDETQYAKYIAELLKTNDSARTMFVAASRGYDMDPDGNGKLEDVQGNDKGLAPDLGYVNIAAAKKALNMIEFTDTTKQAKFQSISALFTEENREQAVALTDSTVAAMATQIDLEEDGGIMVWIGKFLSVLTNITGGYYVLALFFFAVIIEILLLYFSIKQQKNSIKQARMSPKERAIRKKYAGRNDQVSMRKMQEEIQKLYQEEGFNPMSGCLPLLIQMPILIMLYNIIIDPLHYVLGKAEGLSTALSTYATTARAAGGLGLSLSSNNSSIEVLSKVEGKLDGFGNFAYLSNAGDCAGKMQNIQAPNFRLFGLDMSATPSFDKDSNWWLLLIPILTFAAYFFSMKINRKLSYQPAMAAQNQQMGCSNNMMDITMPLMSVFICFMTPAAIGVYWIFKCLIGVAKQFIIQKVMPLPTFTEEDYKQAEKEIKAKSKGQRLHTVVQDASGQQYRSLHHIDDEDDLPPRENVRRSAVYEDEDEDEAPATEQKTESKMAAPLKDDRKNDRKK